MHLVCDEKLQVQFLTQMALLKIDQISQTGFLQVAHWIKNISC